MATTTSIGARRRVIVALAVFGVIAAACEYDPGNASTPETATCGGVQGTHGFGYALGYDPIGGATYEGTEGDDVIVIVNGPVTVNALGGDDLICVNSVFGTAAGERIVINGGEGTDTIVGSPSSIEVCAAEVTSDCDVPASGSIEAITYNVAGLPAVLSGSNPEVNMPLIGPRLNNFDVVLLQESWLTPDPNPAPLLRTYHEVLVAASTLPYQSVPLAAPFGSDPARPSAVLSDGLNRFSNLEFEPVTRQLWDMCGEFSEDCLSLKGFSVSRTTLSPGVTLDVYNLHMDAGGVDFAVRADNVDQLASFIENNSVGNAVIVGGDFNLKINIEPDATQFAELLARGGLTDVCTELSCSEPNRIDKFLYRSAPGISISATEWTNADPDFSDAAGDPLSDHDPVVVTFDWSADLVS